MTRYRCKECGLISPHTKPCFRCGCKDKEKVVLPNVRRRKPRFGGYLMKIKV